MIVEGIFILMLSVGTTQTTIETAEVVGQKRCRLMARELRKKKRGVKAWCRFTGDVKAFTEEEYDYVTSIDAQIATRKAKRQAAALNEQDDTAGSPIDYDSIQLPPE